MIAGHRESGDKMMRNRTLDLFALMHWRHKIATPQFVIGSQSPISYHYMLQYVIHMIH